MKTLSIRSTAVILIFLFSHSLKAQVSIEPKFKSEKVQKQFPQDLKQVCQPAAPIEITSTEIDKPVNYFYKPVPGTDCIAISSSNENFMSCKHPGKNGFTHHKLQGETDPVPSPDGAFLTTSSERGAGVLKFYDMSGCKPLVASTKKSDEPCTKLVFSDERFKGNYQSIGVLGNTKNGFKKYRVVTQEGEGGFQYSDYEIGNGKVGLTVKPLTKAVSFCENLKGSYSLPMLSKDGRYLSVLDTAAHETVILDIKDGKNCEVAARLGIATSKAAFNYGNTQIAFDVSLLADRPDHGLPARLTESSSRDTFVMNLDRDPKDPMKLKLGNISRVSFSLFSDREVGTGMYYPEFFQDNRLLVMKSSQDSRDQFFTYKVAKNDGQPLVAYKPRCPDVENTVPLILGQSWFEICTDFASQAEFQDLAMVPLSLEPSACQRLADYVWNNFEKLSNEFVQRKLRRPMQAQYNEVVPRITKNDLLAACPTASGGKTKTLLGEKQVRDRIEKDLTVETNCGECHRSQTRQGDRSWYTRGIAQVAAGTMPLGVTLDQASKDRLIKALQKKISDKILESSEGWGSHF